MRFLPVLRLASRRPGEKSVTLSLRAQTFSAAEVEREDGGFMGGTSGVVEGTARTYAKGLNATTDQILAGVREKLGPASR